MISASAIFFHHSVWKKICGLTTRGPQELEPGSLNGLNPRFLCADECRLCCVDSSKLPGSVDVPPGFKNPFFSKSPTRRVLLGFLNFGVCEHIMHNRCHAKYKIPQCGSLNECNCSLNCLVIFQQVKFSHKVPV